MVCERGEARRVLLKLNHKLKTLYITLRLSRDHRLDIDFPIEVIVDCLVERLILLPPAHHKFKLETTISNWKTMGN